jgi:S-formylglutathione hydrolase FrmB
MVSQWMTARQAAESGKKLPKIFSVCGTGDGCYRYAVQDAGCFRSLGYDCLFMESPGGHDFYFWDQWLPVFLQWLPLRRKGAQ